MAKLKKSTKADASALTSHSVVVRTYRNQTVVSKVTEPRKSKSEKKKNVNEDFGWASEWASHVLQLPEMMEHYSKYVDGDKFRSALNAATSDFKIAPKIHYIKTNKYTGVVGDKIRIKATDDFGVANVEVRIESADGKLIEEGKAVRYSRKPVMWIYTATVSNPSPVGTIVEAIAADRPQNYTRLKVIVGAATDLSPTTVLIGSR